MLTLGFFTFDIKVHIIEILKLYYQYVHFVCSILEGFNNQNESEANKFWKPDPDPT